MGKKGLVLQSQTKQGRKELRNKLGSLKSLTVQANTKERYTAALERFYDYLQVEGLKLPLNGGFLDPLAAD